MWPNRLPSGEGDMRVKHEAKPVTSGIKYAMNCFVNIHRQRDTSSITVLQQRENDEPVKLPS
ncbi:unnamed protein product [Symbiodinium natans]|uniref:Uncharacterized protein n=1 Tax=Symbiodinium natans TaxID=878477 RepID=A0A812N2R0_9DINO|nr:unnamed protein product [Symbiodinium natans]